MRRRGTEAALAHAPSADHCAHGRAKSGFAMGWPVFVLCWAIAAGIALAFGRDTNWDLRHYHLHNAWALLEGRWALDLAPAGEHSFLHPGLDLPFYLAVRSPLNGWPRIITVLQAGYLGLLAFLALAAVNLACHGKAGRLTGTSVLVAAFGLSGAATLPEAGMTFNDLQIACLVVGALLTLLLTASADGVATWRAAGLRLLAGLLGGAAVGLKLTAVIYLPAFALAAALAVGPGEGSARRIWAVAYLVVGAATGFLLIYGPWGWFLWERFGNPFGPFFNEVFQSPWFPPRTPSDSRFLPHSLGQALIYPLLWARRSQMVVAEPWMADPRFAVGLAALLLAAVLSVWRQARYQAREGGTAAMRSDADRTAARASWVIMAFVLAAYASWLGTFAILRYAVPIEVLLGVPVWMAARGLLAPGMAAVVEAGSAPWRCRRGATACVGAALAGCAFATEYPDWGRLPFGRTEESALGGVALLAAEPVVMPEGTLVVMVGGAVSFVAPFLAGPGISFVGANTLTADPQAAWLGTEVRRILQSHPGPAYAVLRDPEPWEDPAHYHERAPVRALDLDLAAAVCRPLVNNLGTAVRLCRWR